MEGLIQILTIMLIAEGVWAAFILLSIAYMLVTVRTMRGYSRRSDFIEGGVALSLLSIASVGAVGHPHLITEFCAFIVSFGVTAAVILTFISERHIKNIRNIKKLKQNLTSE